MLLRESHAESRSSSRDKNNNDLVELRDQISKALEEVPTLKKRFAGKSLPQEKLAVDRALKFKQSGGESGLLLPAYELLYIWNGFSMTNGKRELLDPILEDVEKEIACFEGSEGNPPLPTAIIKKSCIYP